MIELINVNGKFIHNIRYNFEVKGRGILGRQEGLFCAFYHFYYVNNGEICKSGNPVMSNLATLVVYGL